MKFLIWLLAMLSIWMIFMILKTSWLKNRQRTDVLHIFSGHGIVVPTIRFGSSFDWPKFYVIFADYENLALAKQLGLTDMFTACIQSYQTHYKEGFKASEAVIFIVKE